MATIEVTSAGLIPAPVVFVSQARLLVADPETSPRIFVSQAHLVPGDPPFEPSHARIFVSQALLYVVDDGPPPGESLLVQWDGARWAHRAIVTWDGTAWAGLE